jgi:hypothetical protein
VTTIATDGRTIAGDGLITLSGTIVQFGAVKVERLADGRVIGCCGDASDQREFAAWLVGQGKKPKLGPRFSAIVAAKGQPLRVYFDDCTFDEVVPPFAIGSGAVHAFAALDCGKSPVGAVEIASGRDIYTGGTITELHL